MTDLFMSDLFITITKDRPSISPPVYKPIKNRLRKYISPGLIVGGLRYQTNNAATAALLQIINSIYFEYRSPIRSDYETTLSIQSNSEMNIFVPKFKSERIHSDRIGFGFGLDLHTSNNYSNINIEKYI